ncbi:metallopeptidase family protein [Actinomyces weissii]|uniref:Metallopeptidase family protein n=1 Tax=Actinomyces weissii TaxID=675090 RepID=A0A7T7MA28_9ACTO|nr:metallopeptidase family protein [Actinomyces weissii]QQM67613.1 metallopeptidase family protein [Actinomyces weissii]
MTPPVHLTEEELDAAVEAALDLLPEELTQAMDNVALMIQDEPDPEQLTDQDYDEDGLPTLLGLYEGTPLTERDESWNLVLPDQVTVFVGPLSRWCRNREELVHEIAVTVIHELAHHFGIDDARLHELGWD